MSKINVEIPPLECPAVLLPQPKNLMDFFGLLASEAERALNSVDEDLRKEGEKLKEILDGVRSILSPYDPKFQRLSIPEHEFKIMIQRLIEEYHMYVPSKILDLINSVLPITFTAPIPGLGISVDILKIATDREYLNTIISQIDVDSMYDLLPSEYKLFNGEYGLVNAELKAKQIQDFIKNEVTKFMNGQMFDGFGGLISKFDTIWSALGLPSLPVPLSLDIKGLIDAAIANAQTDAEKLLALKNISIAGFSVEDLLGGEIDDNLVSLEFTIARINQKLKEFEQSWQTFLLKEWMNKVTSFFDAIGLGALTQWITFDFCMFMSVIGVPKTIDLSGFGGIKTKGNEFTSALGSQSIVPPV